MRHAPGWAGLAFTVAILAGGAGAQTGTAGSAPDAGDDWRSALELVQEKLSAAGAKQARALLLATLEHHRDSESLQTARPAIEELVSRIEFLAAYRPPRPNDVVAGDLVEYDSRSGRIKIRYTPDQLRDDARPKRPAALRREDEKVWQELEKARRMLESLGGAGMSAVHPVIFKGPYTVTVAGRSYPGGPTGFHMGYVRVLAALDESVGYDVVFGAPKTKDAVSVTWIPSSIGRFENGKREALASKDDAPTMPGKPFRAVVRVEAGAISASFNGRSLLRAKRSNRAFGRAGVQIVGNADITEITFDGLANTAWIQNLLDALQDAARKEFNATFRPRDHLPAWLYPSGVTPATSEAAEPSAPAPRALPSDADAPSADVAKTVDAALAAKDTERARRALADARDVPPLTKTFLQARISHGEGAWEDACRLLDTLCVAEPRFARGSALRGECHLALGRDDAARADFAAALRVEPSVPWLRAFVPLALSAGDVQAATAATTAARARGVIAEDLDDTLHMVAFGPEWANRYSYSSANYEVVSEIDQGSCRRASEILEAVRSFFAEDLGNLDRKKPERSKVYLFAGESGYQAYCKRILGGAVPHTGGLYSSILKQLLIWNLPDRDQMWRVVRHEALHQYLDEVVGDVALWLNEGLAENYALCDSGNRSTWRTGQTPMQSLHLATLSMRPLTPLHRFLRMTRRQFYADPALNYGQSWALVRLLLHGEQKHRLVFDRLRAALHDDPAGAVAIAFDGVDLADLQADLEQAITKWRERR